ncbi:hypothetical protein HOJ01_02620 [bacterium]|nr:hypothetical protein [bacterium]
MNQIDYKHIRTVSNSQGRLEAWIGTINGSYTNFVKLADENGYHIYTQDSEQVKNHNPNLLDTNLQISEDINSIKSVFELYLKVAINNLDRQNYLRALRIRAIPVLERDITEEKLLSSSGLHQLENFYNGFFIFLMQEQDFNAYHTTYHEYRKLIKDMKNFPPKVTNLTNSIKSNIQILKNQLNEIVQFYNLLQVACLPIIFYIEIVKSLFQALIREKLNLSLDVNQNEEDINQVFEKHLSSSRIQIPSFDIYHFSSPFTIKTVSLPERIALDQIVK